MVNSGTIHRNSMARLCERGYSEYLMVFCVEYIDRFSAQMCSSEMLDFILLIVTMELVSVENDVTST